MNIWVRIKRLNSKQLFQLSLLFLSRPLLIRPTLRASKRTMFICDDLFGSRHHKSNKANAFRHALWNVLICQKTLKKTNNREKSVIWTKKVTDLYEKVTQNEFLDQLMDLHNNEIGRTLFLDLFDKNEATIINYLKEKSENAQKLTETEDVTNFKGKLVYLEE